MKMVMTDWGDLLFFQAPPLIGHSELNQSVLLEFYINRHLVEFTFTT